MMRVKKKNPHAGKSGCARDFIKAVDAMTHSRQHRDVLRDFAEAAYCAMAVPLCAGAPARAKALEDRYQAVVDRHGGEPYQAQLIELASIAMQGVTTSEGDFLGPIVEEIGSLNSRLGQYFTPYWLSEWMARATLEEGFVQRAIEKQGFVSVMEPACGAGVMAIAAANTMRKLGYDPQTHLWVTAIDIDDFLYKVAYLQLAWRGIPADLIHGNALTDERWEVMPTPAKLMFCVRHNERLNAAEMIAAQMVGRGS